MFWTQPWSAECGPFTALILSDLMPMDLKSVWCQSLCYQTANRQGRGERGEGSRHLILNLEDNPGAAHRVIHITYIYHLTMTCPWLKDRSILCPVASGHRTDSSITWLHGHRVRGAKDDRINPTPLVYVLSTWTRTCTGTTRHMVTRYKV